MVRLQVGFTVIAAVWIGCGGSEHTEKKACGNTRS